MKLAERIQYLRKNKGVSQEELADQIGVSRQAVSKWESEQSLPDLDRIIAMSEYFHVTTDYILRGIEPVADKKKERRELTSQILYIASVAFVIIGLLCAFGGWYEKQALNAVSGSMIIQAVGVAGYFIAKLMSHKTASIAIRAMHVAGLLFMPASMISGALSQAVFKQGWIAPYPQGIWQTALFVLLYVGGCVGWFAYSKNQRKRPAP